MPSKPSNKFKLNKSKANKRFKINRKTKHKSFHRLRHYIVYVNDSKDDEIIDPSDFKNEFWNNDNKNIFNENSNTKPEKSAANPTDYISSEAAVKILELIRMYWKKLNILCLDPQTNLSLKIILDA